MEQTNHSEVRIRKRIGIKKKSVDRIKNKAFEIGLKHNESNGRLRKYFDSLFFKNKTATNIRMYSNFVWIFDNIVLITVFPIPSNLIKVVEKLLKRRKCGNNI